MYVVTVEEEAGFGMGEADGECPMYVRVCTLVEILYAQINSALPHQCVVDDRFAVCVLGRVARPRADGIYD